MKNFNWLVQLLFYKHNEEDADTSSKEEGVFYEVGYIDQLHANLCTNASENMINYFLGKSISTMAVNPRGIFEGTEAKKNNYDIKKIDISDIENTLKNSGPFILSLPLNFDCAHSVVVTGCTKNKIIYNDPLTGAHKIMSFQTLSGLHPKDIKIEIACIRELPDNYLNKHQKKQISAYPKNIIPSDYQEFFSLDKMISPEKAVINFLQDYSEFSLWHWGRHHKKSVSEFIKLNQKENIETILNNLIKSFPEKNPNGELQLRINTIMKIFNKEAPGNQEAQKPRP